MLEVAHAASTGRLSALGLLSPLVRPQLSTRVAALRALYIFATVEVPNTNCTIAIGQERSTEIDQVRIFPLHS